MIPIWRAYFSDGVEKNHQPDEFHPSSPLHRVAGRLPCNGSVGLAPRGARLTEVPLLNQLPGGTSRDNNGGGGRFKYNL